MPEIGSPMAKWKRPLTNDLQRCRTKIVRAVAQLENGQVATLMTFFGGPLRLLNGPGGLISLCLFGLECGFAGRQLLSM